MTALVVDAISGLAALATPVCATSVAATAHTGTKAHGLATMLVQVIRKPFIEIRFVAGGPRTSRAT
jgi:hypothetical protein